jgi:hypothetical protein
LLRYCTTSTKNVARNVGAMPCAIDSNKIGEGVVKREKKRETPLKTS